MYRLSSAEEFKYSMGALLVILINVIISATFFFGIEMEKHDYLLPYLVVQAVLIIISYFAACILLLFSFLGAIESIEHFFNYAWVSEAVSEGDAAFILRLMAGCLIFGVVIQSWFFSIAIDCFRHFMAKRRDGYVGRFDKLHIRQPSIVHL
uniref:Uncharacterized protein n=1 Tax=Plectus sambesii TaxID=2011161 RepID=A0A914WUI5_9BILA